MEGIFNLYIFFYMQLLVLPSKRLLQLHQSIYHLLPLEAQEVIQYHGHVAILHYKSFSVFEETNMQKPILNQMFLKKLQTFDLYQNQKGPECVLADKFGDMYRLTINEQPQPIFINSNLGIPKFIKHIHHQNKQYFMLGDEENRIKVYNSHNPHEIMSIWFLINMYPLECLVKENIVILFKYEDKTTLQHNFYLNWLKPSQLENEEYPGRNIEIQYKFNPKCKYYTITSYQQMVAFVVLEDEQIVVELLEFDGDKYVYRSMVNYEIQKGNWDYMHVVEGDGLMVVYGADVQAKAEIEESEWKDQQKIRFNEHEHLCQIKI